MLHGLESPEPFHFQRFLFGSFVGSFVAFFDIVPPSGQGTGWPRPF